MYVAWLASARRHAPPQKDARLWQDEDGYLTIPKGVGKDFVDKANRWATDYRVIQRYRPVIGNAYVIGEHVVNAKRGSNLETAHRLAALLAKVNLSFMSPGQIKREFQLLNRVSADPPAAGPTQNVPRAKEPGRGGTAPKAAGNGDAAAGTGANTGRTAGGDTDMTLEGGAAASGTPSAASAPTTEKPADGNARASGRKRKRPVKEDDEEKGEGNDEDKELAQIIEGTVLTTSPDVQWDDVAGLDAAKEALEQAVIYPVDMPQLFTAERKPWKGILLYGPPGTGKTHLARAVATEANCTFFSISAADIMSKWHGMSERAVRMLFRLARARKPSIIFVDEIDSICPPRGSAGTDMGRILTEFLCQTDGLKGDNTGVFVLAATNLPGKLDRSALRRFALRIEVPLPDARSRAKIIKLGIGGTPTTLTEAEIEQLAQVTEGYSGSDVSGLVQTALYRPIVQLKCASHFKEVLVPVPGDPRKTVKRLLPCAADDPDPTKRKTELKTIKKDVMCPAVTMNDFMDALSSARPSISQGDLQDIEAFTRDFGTKA